MLITLAAVPASAQTGTLVLEVTLAAASPSPSQQAAWGWWNPSKAERWTPVNGSDDALAEVRLLSPGEPMAVFLAAERYPKLVASALRTIAPRVAVAESTVSMELETYDLGFSQWYGSEGRFAVMPWLGATSMRITESRTSASGASSASHAEAAESRLWGVGLGSDISVRLVERWALMGRLCGRWARGDRTAHVLIEGPAEGGETFVEQSDETSLAMLGGELGLRWSATPTVIVDGGWRCRSWRFDGGPGSFDGPFLRLIVGF